MLSFLFGKPFKIDCAATLDARLSVENLADSEDLDVKVETLSSSNH